MVVTGRTPFEKLTDMFGGTNPFGDVKARNMLTGGGQNANRVAVSLSIRGMEREMNRLLGFKTDLTPSENRRLSELQAEIQLINEKDNQGTGASAEEVRDRTEAYREAFAIMGKEYVDAGANVELQGVTRQIDDLLAPKLRPADRTRLERLRVSEESALQAVARTPESEGAFRNLRNIRQQIAGLNVQREVSRLSPAERRQYDELVTQANAIAGTTFLLPSRDKIRVEQLNKSIGSLKVQEAAFGGPISVSPSEAARAYAGV